MGTSSIGWTEKTNNSIYGCSKKSAGCQNCYALTMAHRLEAIANSRLAKGQNLGKLANYIGLTEKRGDRVEWTGKVTFDPSALEEFSTGRESAFFINSMSDIAHENVQYEWFEKIMDACEENPGHT